MASSTKRSKGSGPVRERVEAHRDRLRAQVLRPIQIWVPDTRAPGFADEVRGSHVVRLLGVTVRKVFSRVVVISLILGNSF